MIETTKVTLSYELPKVLVEVLEKMARENGHSFEDELIDHLARTRLKRRSLSSEETRKHMAALERYFGCWDSGDPNSSDNERIDADLAREYANDHEGEDE